MTAFPNIHHWPWIVNSHQSQRDWMNEAKIEFSVIVHEYTGNRTKQSKLNKFNKFPRWVREMKNEQVEKQWFEGCTDANMHAEISVILLDSWMRFHFVVITFRFSLKLCFSHCDKLWIWWNMLRENIVWLDVKKETAFPKHDIRYVKGLLSRYVIKTQIIF
jgi:hypothetical protein